MNIAGLHSKKLIWDWPTRCFHWALALLIVVLFITGKLGGNWMEWHAKSGYAVLGLIAFRLCWGAVGSTTARFSSFVRGPKTILCWIRGGAVSHVGHNPLGALSVVAMITLIGVQAVTGLFANDDIMTEGPYATAVGKENSDLVTKIHKINSNVIAGFTILHLLAIVAHSVRKGRGMVMAMVTGRGEVPAETTLKFVPGWLAVVLALIIALGIAALVNKGPPF